MVSRSNSAARSSDSALTSYGVAKRPAEDVGDDLDVVVRRRAAGRATASTRCHGPGRRELLQVALVVQRPARQLGNREVGGEAGVGHDQPCPHADPASGAAVAGAARRSASTRAWRRAPGPPVGCGCGLLGAWSTTSARGIVGLHETLPPLTSSTRMPTSGMSTTRSASTSFSMSVSRRLAMQDVVVAEAVTQPLPHLPLRGGGEGRALRDQARHARHPITDRVDARAERRHRLVPASSSSNSASWSICTLRTGASTISRSPARIRAARSRR